MAPNPNIILLIIDTLRFDKLGSSGYQPNVTPNIDRLVNGGCSFVNNHSNGCVTSVAFPSIFTSTMPFDYGGYDDGIINRPRSFPEVLQTAGYQNYGLITGHPCSSHFGYDRGFDHFYDLIDFYQWFRAVYVTYLAELIEDYVDNNKQSNKIFETIIEKYKRVLLDTLGYIDKLQALPVRLPQQRKRKRIRAKVKAELRLIEMTPNLVIDKMILLAEDYQNYLGVPKLSKTQLKYRKWKKRIASKLNRRVFILSQRRAVGASYVNALFTSLMSNRESKPCFAVLHYFDLHEAKLQISKVFFSLNLIELLKFLTGFFACWVGRKPGQGGLLYDIALRRIDHDVGKFLKVLQDTGMAENTIIVVTGDHGTEAGYPMRNFGSNLSRLFYKEHLHVPLTFYGKGIEPKKDQRLVSHMDLAPTILGVVNCPVPVSFCGVDLIKNQQHVNTEVWSENAGKGRCLLSSKRLFLGRRTKEWNVIGYSDNFEPTLTEFYNLERDPFEQHNLIGNVPKDVYDENIQAFKKRMLTLL
jgi:arylsulfatase A-like enzyme